MEAIGGVDEGLVDPPDYSDGEVRSAVVLAARFKSTESVDNPVNNTLLG